mmetsp:Transcript_30920/g.42302  ORF Transcript_30920/g.42302 Transcript_30920/m.42302 type:complete len:207 (-) Transcript_30920:331-951(-)
MSAPFPSIATDTLKSQGVEVVMDRVVSHEGNVAILQSGGKINYDLFIPTNPSGGCNGSFLPVECLDSKGYITVNHFLQVEGLPKVFAMGDCSNRNSKKGEWAIRDQLPILLKNVVALAQEKPLTPHVLGKFRASMLKGPIFVAIGHHHPDAFGVGPDFPQPLRCILWLCCCFTSPCHTPSSKELGKLKTKMDMEMTPKAGKGIIDR